LKKKFIFRDPDPDPDPTGGNNHEKVNEQYLTQCPSDPDPDPTGELALTVWIKGVFKLYEIIISCPPTGKVRT
jgi:hypothetical protein